MNAFSRRSRSGGSHGARLGIEPCSCPSEGRRGCRTRRRLAPQSFHARSNSRQSYPMCQPGLPRPSTEAEQRRLCNTKSELQYPRIGDAAGCPACDQTRLGVRSVGVQHAQHCRQRSETISLKSTDPAHQAHFERYLQQRIKRAKAAAKEAPADSAAPAAAPATAPPP